MTNFRMLAVALALGLTAPASIASANEQTPAPTTIQSIPSTPSAQNSADAGKMVCRSMGAPTGSRLGTQRVCMTQREWDDQRMQAQRTIGKWESNVSLPGKGN